MEPSSSLGFFLGPGFPLGFGVESPKAPEFLFVPLGAAGFFLIASVGGSIAVGPLRATGTGVVSALISVGGDEVLAMVLLSVEEDDGFATASALAEGGLSFRRKSGDTLNLMMRGPFGGGFLDLLLLATAGEAVEGGFEGMVMVRIVF